MFLHIVAVDRQYSAQADEKKPLSAAVDVAFKYYKKRRTAKHKAKDVDGDSLALSKSPKALGLKENDMVYVR